MEYDREKLLAALNAAYPALGGGVVSELGYFWFDKKYLYATDSGLGIRVELKTDLDCGIPGKQLRDLVKSSSLKTVEITVGKAEATLKMGKSKVQLATLDSERRPWKYPDVPATYTVKLSGPIRTAWERLSFVRVSKGLHAFHYGIVMIPAKDGLEFYTTDSRSLASVIVKDKAPKGTAPVILPWPWVERVQALTEPGEATMSVLSDCLVAAGGTVVIYSNLLEYPDEPDLPAVCDKQVSEVTAPLPLPDGMAPALERAAILAGAAEPWINLAVGKGGFHVTGKYTVGSLDEQLAVKGKAPDAAGEFRADLLTRALPHVKELGLTKQVLVMFGDEEFVYIVAGKGT